MKSEKQVRDYLKSLIDFRNTKQQEKDKLEKEYDDILNEIKKGNYMIIPENISNEIFAKDFAINSLNEQIHILEIILED